jgi:hypothetical protein
MLLFTSCLVPNRTLLPFAPSVLSVLRRGRFSHLTRANIVTNTYTSFGVFVVVSIWLLRCHRKVSNLTHGLFPVGLRPAAAHQSIPKMPCCSPADRSPTYTHKNDPVLDQVAQTPTRISLCSGLFCCLPDLV